MARIFGQRRRQSWFCAILYAAFCVGALAASASAAAPAPAAASAAAPAPAAAPKKPLTHETLWMMKRVGAPTVSPDGKWAVYSVLEPSYEQDKAVSDLWLVATDGSTPPRRITHTKEAEDDVDWSADSTRRARERQPFGPRPTAQFVYGALTTT